MPPLPLTDWRAEQIRLSIFPAPGATARLVEWWEAVADRVPDDRTENPKRGVAVVSGAFAPGKLVLSLEPERIDWLLVPPDSDDLPEEGPPDLGSMTATLDSFSRIIQRWLGRDDVPEVARLAFGAVLKHPEPNAPTAYARLPEYVPVRVDPNSSDFLYQVNVPVASRSVEDLQINRLSKWAVTAARRLSVRFVPGAGTFTHQQVTDPVIAFRLELDVNTSPTFQDSLPRPRLLDLYLELVSLGQEIVRAGIAQR